MASTATDPVAAIPDSHFNDRHLGALFSDHEYVEQAPEDKWLADKTRIEFGSVGERPYGDWSNLANHYITYKGNKFLTVEHFYQSAKFHMAANELERLAKNPKGKAKEIPKGKIETLRAVAREICKTKGSLLCKDVAKKNEPLIAEFLDNHWKNVRLGVMRTGLWVKFTDTRMTKERKLLMSTGTRYILEFSNVDKYFAVMPGGEGENWLGRLLMDIRDELAHKGQQLVDSCPACVRIKDKYPRGVLDMPLVGSKKGGGQKAKGKGAGRKPKTPGAATEQEDVDSNKDLDGDDDGENEDEAADGDEDEPMGDVPDDDPNDGTFHPNNPGAAEGVEGGDDDNDDDDNAGAPRVPKLKPWEVQPDPEVLAVEAELRAAGVFDEDNPVMRVFDYTFDGPIEYTS